jgi:hypothetical protein
MFQINDVFNMDEQRYRVIAMPVEHVVLFNLDERLAEPEIHPRLPLESLADDDGLIRIKDPYAEHIANAGYANKKDKAVRDRRFKVIKDIVSDPEFFISSRRKELFKEARLNHDKKSKFLWQQCRLYWKKGLVPNALIGKLCNSGARGKIRTFVDSRGGPNKYKQQRTKAIVTQAVRSMFSSVINKFYLIECKSFAQTYRKFQARYHTKFHVENSKDIPTINQMRQHYKMEYLEIDTLKKQTDKYKYEKDIKAKSSTINTQVNGPGDIFETDATLAKIFLVCERDRSLIIGKPTLMLVKDIFSRKVIGWYLGFENPSYYSNVLALASAITDNTNEFKEAGFENVPKGLVPVTFCQQLVADKGELNTHHGDVLRNQFGITFSTTRSYGSDAKGMIERAIRSVEQSFEDDLPGVAEAIKAKKQGGKDKRLEANVTLRELRKYVLEEILIHNQYGNLSGNYDRDEDMPVDLPLTPSSLWQWGILNRMGTLKSVSRKAFLLAMLPRGKATTSVNGFCFNGIYYWSDKFEKLGFFEKIRSLCPYDELECIYDPSCMDNITVVLPGKVPEFVQCPIADLSRYYRSCSLQEVKVLQKAIGQTDAETKQEHEDVLVDRENKKEQFIKELKKKKPRGYLESDAARIKGIPKNRSEALAQERAERMEEGTIFEPVNELDPNDEEHQDEALHNPEVAELLKNKRN